MKGYIGTYATNHENGVYSFTFDEQKKEFVAMEVCKHDKDTKYVSLYNDVLAYPFASPSAAIKVLQKGQEYVVGKEAHVSCYITQDEDYIYTANYHDGVVNRYKKELSGVTLDGSIVIQELAGTHQVILYDNVIFVPCRLLDCVNVYDRTSLQLTKTITFPKESGPRHGVIDETRDEMYIISENTCEIFCVDVYEPYTIKRALPLLQEEQQGGGAAIRMSQDHRFLYVSVRDINQLYVIDIEQWTVIQTTDCGGDHPRDIALDPSQHFLFVANRFSNNLVVFERNKQSGYLHKITTVEDIYEGVSIVFEGEQTI